MKTYILGTLGGEGGRRINYAGGIMFESMDNGEFTNKAAARKAAAELAHMWARGAEDGICEIAVACSDGPTLDLLTVATATFGQKMVEWS